MEASWRDDEFERLASEVWEPLEGRVRAFEAALSAGDRPPLTAYLPVEDPSGGQLLVELVHAELEFRIAAGEPARVEEYLARFPALADRPAAVAGLIVAEFEHRRPREPKLNRSEYRRRFPDQADALAGFDTVDSAATLGGTGPIRPMQMSDDVGGLPGYELIEEIDRGGMGVVYKAIESRLKRLVAVKTVRPGADAAERERLRREAEAAASLQHPNVVEIYRVFEHAGRLYVVSEYLPGGTLAQRAAGSPLTPREAAKLLEPVARAVGDAHAQGVVHRDLKPSNILLAADGTPKVADFGLAKRLDDDNELTRTGVVAGSPSYMAPEQATAERDIGPAADIWALGAILYELLTGRPPFRGATALDTLEQLRRDEPVAPRKLVPRLPRDLETVCLHCLEKSPSQRYRSAAELADELARFRRGEPVRARPIGPAERVARWLRRRPSAAALLLTLVLAVAAGAAGLAAYVTQLDRLNETLAQTVKDRDDALAAQTAARTQADAARRRAEASERHARRLLFASDMRQAAEAVRGGNLVRAKELLDAHREQTDGEYSFVWNHLDRLVHAPGSVIDDLGGPAYFVCFSPDGKTLAACGQPGEIRLYEAGSWKPRGRIAAGQGELNGLAFSPDGTRLASAGDDGTVVLWDLATRRELWRQKIYETPAYQVAFGLGGSIVAVCGRHPNIVLLDAATAAEVGRLRADDQAVEGIAATPEGDLVVTAGHKGRALAWDLATRKVRWHFDTSARDVVKLTSVSVSPDGRLAAFGGRSATVALADLRTGRFRRATISDGRLGLDASWLRATAFLPSSDGLAAVGDAGIVRLAGIADEPFVGSADLFVPLRDRPRTGWVAHGGRIAWVAAEGGAVVTAARDGTISAWLPDGELPWGVIALHPGSRNVTFLAATKSGDRPARIAGSNNGEWNLPRHVSLFDPTTGTREVVTDEETDWWDIDASADGRRMFATGQTGEVVGWDTSGGSPVELFRRQLPSNGPVGLGTATRDGRRVVVDYWPVGRAVDDETELSVLDGATGVTLAARRFPLNTPDAAFSEDGSLIAAAPAEILLLDPQTLATRRTLSGHDENIQALALSRDGRQLASAGDDREVIVWDTASGRPIRRWQADAGEITSVAFSPDGRLLLTATDSRPPRLWDIETGRLLLEPGSAPAPAGIRHWWRAVFTPDGGRILAGRRDKVILLDGRPRERISMDRP